MRPSSHHRSAAARKIREPSQPSKQRGCTGTARTPFFEVSMTTAAHLERRLEAIRGSTLRRTPNVRVLAGYAQHVNCNLSTLGFAAGVNFDRLLVKTRFQMPFGQSPFAIGRGFGFEKLLRA